MTLRIPAVLLALGLTVQARPSAMAQSVSVEYQAQVDTLHYELTNPYRMYWVRGADTVGGWVRERSVESQAWRTAGPKLRVVVAQLSLNVQRRATVDTFLVARDGLVEQINGHAPGLKTRVDLVPRLRNPTVRVGARWADTVNATSDGPAGRHVYRVEREYRVQRVIDSLSHRLADVLDSGSVHYRDAWWADSTAGTFGWLDVAGPTSETFLVDLDSGRLLERRWKMELTGRGGGPIAAGAVDTVPAGLISSEVTELISAARAGQLSRPLPGRDTSWTINAGPVLLHAVLHNGDSVASGLSRNDGLIGTVTTRYSNHRPIGYRAVWTDSLGETSTTDINVLDGKLHLQQMPGRDTTFSPPSPVWGIADYAMQEHLVPVLLALPADNVPHSLAVYRPVGGHWDQGDVWLRPIHGGYIAMLQFAGDKQPQYLLITTEGDLLFGENSDPVGAERIPLPGTARRAQLESILQELKPATTAPPE